MTASSNNEIFPEIPGFTILKTLGRGGMAQVYLAVQKSMEREVAIKVMLPQLLADPSFGDRFLREARIAAKLAHPHIVAVIDVAVANDLYYMAMEYHPGGDLTARIQKGLPEKDAIRIIKEIAAALNYANTNGFVHRDIKPDNILFSRSGSAVLSDFGIARAADGGTQLTATGSIIGTPHYMSPEQAQGKPIDGRADLYSLGVMFYQMLVGKVPFDGESAMSIGIKHIRDPIPKLPAHLAKFETLLEKLLAKEPEERWQSGADVVRTLEVLEIKDSPVDGATLSGTATSGQVQSTQVNPVHASGGQKKKSPLGLVAGVLAVVAIGGAVAWQQGFLSNSDGTDIAVEEPTPSPAEETTAPRNTDTKAEETTVARIADTQVEETMVAKVAPTPPATKPVQKLEPKPAPKVEQKPILKPAPLVESTPKAESKPDPLEIKLSGYVRDATDFLSSARLSESRIESATRLYRSAYILAPSDRRVQRLPEQIANGYEVLADEARLQKNWDKASRLADRGLAMLPDHRGLKTLVAKIDSDKKVSGESTSSRRVFGGF